MNNRPPDSYFSDLKRGVQAMFVSLIAYNQFVVLDLETTGIDRNTSGIVQIGILNAQGEPLMNTLVNPGMSIDQGATNVHGISDEMVVDAQTFDQLHHQISEIINGKVVVIYNAPFDAWILQARALARDLPPFMPKRWMDVMLPCGDWYGDWNLRHKSIKWKKLTELATYLGVTDDGDAHDALVDCRLTLGVIQAIAAKS